MTSAPSPATKSFWSLGGLTSWQLSRAVFEQMIANNVFGRAAELAFYFLFALFRLIFFMMTLFGLFASYSVELQNNLLSYFADFLPPAAFQLLRRVAIEIAAHASHGKLTFGVVSALWCVSSSLCSMISALNAAHHVREARSCLKVRAIALGLRLLISILLVTALFMVPVGSRFVGSRTSTASIGGPRLEGHAVAGCYLLRRPVVFAGLLLRSRFKRAEPGSARRQRIPAHPVWSVRQNRRVR